MKILLISLVVTISTLTFAREASAGVDADPDGNGASVRLHAVEEWKPLQRSPGPPKLHVHLVEPTRLNKWGGVPCVVLPDGSTRCFGQPALPAPKSKLSPGEILEATRKIGLPSLTITIQPGTATLVNLDTIFFARPQPFSRSVTLLGYDIDLRAAPVSYTWRHGDGTSHATRSPGAPYPSKDVTYRYQQPATHVSPSVDVTYQVRYRVDGGAWQTLSQTLTANGQPSDLEVKEAGAVLTSY